MITDWAEWLGNSALSNYIQEDPTAFPILEVLHVVAIALVVGSIFIVDLRLLNLCSKTYRVSRLLKAVLPMTGIAFTFAVITGFLMFASQPVRYLHTTPFLLKMGLLVLAGANMLLFHAWTHRGITKWDDGDAIPRAARVAGLVSLILWVAILFAGRFVGFLLAF